MGIIKSAYELAMERTEDIKIDKESVAAANRRESGMRLISSFLNGDKEIKAISKELSQYDKKEVSDLKEGILKVLLANISITETGADKDRLQKVKDAFQNLGSKHSAELVEQLIDFIDQYAENKKKIRDSLAEQYEPTLRRKEQEIQSQTGTAIRLQPEQDPEFVKILQSNYSKMRAQYDQALKQAKSELKI